ncbi:MAG: tRNA (adenosine(37)-N6)-threonylcarbamoyltransferase complex transferase subunit TsaD [Anaerovibrio sp.]|nr:tRNA (adenosine(37)-N6)-threonylcarbamoyltransferase complex transferase subunit TsaD [Selenomonadaceae bacterium]MDD6397619.1 tRNA (adenosine(37)-N6)-threonylcarbamoyltransferase complex transferase subunit TsaD [Selenomonadaceae bacterium]MDY6053941.1 tRNA (adenosine(37)-N6)-threonylcarbamoyltransferase complex transferase subunit TsaD [Anaerovibrio sp.]
MKENMITLAIESSCDETSAAILRGGREVVSLVISTQIPIHQKFGGVVPEIASRKHIVNIMPVIEETLQKAKLELKDIDQIAVTYGPGLVGALLVGVSAAKALAFTLDVPLIGVNHLEGHIFANFLSHPDLKPPFMALVVSGGHTSLVHVKDYNSFKLMGQTRDDAAGEAFDKVARVMGLPYPGGPQIDKLAKEGNPLAIDFPQAMKNEENFEFSFSGLKSAVLNYLNSMQQKHIEINKADVAASFQHSVIEVLIAKAMQAVQESHCDTLVLAGGVAANSSLESRLREAADKAGIRFCFPNKLLCTDNAAMIGCRGYYKALAGFKSDYYLNAVPGLGLEDL